MKNKLVKSTLFLTILLSLLRHAVIAQTTYIEEFNTAGAPSGLPSGDYWYFSNSIYPDQDTWNEFIPGDGYAYLIVDADEGNDTDLTNPYQILGFGDIGENHRLEVRMKGAVVDGGLVGFIFTYNQTGSTFNEIDIELVADDENAPPVDHDVYPPNGWTDARFNTWRNADESTFLPHTGSKKPIVDASNNDVSHIDDQFHTYTIDWRSDRIDFFIDNILQETFTTNIATGQSEVILGFRDLVWAGPFNWSGTKTLVIDYFKIEPLETLSNIDLHMTESYIKFYPNPVSNQFRINGELNLYQIEILNSIGQICKVINPTGNVYEVDISTLSSGLYFMKVKDLSNNMLEVQKIIKE